MTSLPFVVELQITDDALNLHPQLGAKVYVKFMEVVSDVIWRSSESCRSMWFPLSNIDMPEGEALDEFPVLSDPYLLDDTHLFLFVSDGYHRKLYGPALIHTFNMREGIYDTVPREFWIYLDVALAMSGSEAVVECYYSDMKKQHIDGGQSTETLAYLTNTDGLLPIPVPTH